MSNVNVSQSHGKQQPKINFREPDLKAWGPLHTEEAVSLDDFHEVVRFYEENLIPDIVCSATGPAYPSINWLVADGRKTLICRRKNGRMVGCWVLKDHQIYYPCVDFSKGYDGALPIFRALSYKSWEIEGEDLCATTSNPVIQEWVRKIADEPEHGMPNGMPIARFIGNRVEWKKA